MKQQSLKEQRNYRINPRRDGEIDESFRGDIEAFEPSRTKQSDAEGADINNIIRKFTADGGRFEDLQVQFREDDLIDVSDAVSYHEAQNIIAQGNSVFHALPPQVRAQFKNDPAEMLKFIDDAPNDPKKVDKLLELGLARKREPAPETEMDVLKTIRDNIPKPKKTKDKPDSGALSED